MPRSADFQKIYNRFIKQYGKNKGRNAYYAWLNKHNYKEEEPFPGGKEKKERLCIARGFELKEDETSFHVRGLIATSHIDSLKEQDGISDKIPKETLESFANQINTNFNSRIMGIHHSEGLYGEYFGVADIEKEPATVVSLNDGEWGLMVDTKLLKNDPKTPYIIDKVNSGELDSFSITYDTKSFTTVDFDRVEDEIVRILGPDTELCGYTLASNPVNKNAIITEYGYKEFKELIKKEEIQMSEIKKTEPAIEPVKTEIKENITTASVVNDAEQKEFMEWKRGKELKEMVDKIVPEVIKTAVNKIEIKEKVLTDNTAPKEIKERPLEIKEFIAMVKEPSKVEIKEQFNRAAKVMDALNLDWTEMKTTSSESRKYEHFSTNGRMLEFKGLGITTNQNTDTDYLQSTAELQDIFDPVIYNALNQATTTFNLLAKDDYSRKGNNQVQFKLKIAANATAAFYTGNNVTTGNVTRMKYQTKFKKLQVGVSVDDDMIAAARGGPVNDVFAQEVMDSTMDMLSVLNAALFAEVGLETAAAPIGFEYISDSAGNPLLYNVTRTAANKLAPDSPTDTYINGNSSVVSLTNLRAMKRQALKEGANLNNLVYITNPVQGDMLRGIFDNARRIISASDTKFGFSTDLSIDGIPVFEDKDCNPDDWWLIDLETHRIGIWQPPTIERLGKTADSSDAFIKMYFAVYNRAPRRLCQCYGNATS